MPTRTSRCPSPTEPAPPGITCAHYRPVPGSKRCLNYQAGGICQRPEAARARCLEWVKLNAPAEVHDKPARDLFGTPIEPDPRRSHTTAGAPPVRLATASRDDKPPLVRNVTDEEIASFKALGAAVCIRSAAMGDVWLVPEYTGADRAELSVEHSATLTAICAAFPGAKVVAMNRRDG